jgi:hypothetical protein
MRTGVPKLEAVPKDLQAAQRLYDEAKAVSGHHGVSMSNAINSSRQKLIATIAIMATLGASD